MTATPISAEDYFRNETVKGNKQQTDIKLNKPRDILVKAHNDVQINKMEMKRKDTEPKVIQPGENMDAECNEVPQQFTSNKAIDKRDLCKQTQKQENFTMTRLGHISQKLGGLCYL